MMDDRRYSFLSFPDNVSVSTVFLRKTLDIDIIIVQKIVHEIAVSYFCTFMKTKKESKDKIFL